MLEWRYVHFGADSSSIGNDLDLQDMFRGQEQLPIPETFLATASHIWNEQR